MRVYGEAFLLMNLWMDFLSLLLAAGLARTRFPIGRGLLAAALGAGYGLIAFLGGPAWRGIPALAAAALVMGFMVFGRLGIRLCPLIWTAGWLLSGCAEFLLDRGLGAAEALALCGGAALLPGLILKRSGAGGAEGFTLRVTLNGKTAVLPALRDSGNLLRDGITGLPVIVAPERALRGLLPPGVRAGDLSTLPNGWRLMRIRTAAGSRTVMCFHPDQITLRRGGRKWSVQGAVAVADFGGNRALLPEELCQQKEEGIHAGL